MVYSRAIEVRTGGRSDFVEITSQVARIVKDAKVADGLVCVYVPHTTAGVTINENADPDVIHDILASLDKQVPWREPFHQHGEGNAAAHVKSSMMGCQTTIPIAGGELSLGTWQGVYFAEFDGPRSRRVIITVTGE